MRSVNLSSSTTYNFLKVMISKFIECHLRLLFCYIKGEQIKNKFLWLFLGGRHFFAHHLEGRIFLTFTFRPSYLIATLTYFLWTTIVLILFLYICFLVAGKNVCNSYNGCNKDLKILLSCPSTRINNCKCILLSFNIHKGEPKTAFT